MQDVLLDAKPIRFKDALAETLGVFKKDECREFQDLWMEKVREMLVEKKDIDKWLKIEKTGA